MRLIVAVLAATLLALAGCGQAMPLDSPTPSPAGTPSAATYADPAALYAAIQKAGTPKVEGLGVGSFSDRGGMPSSAHAKRGNFMVASPGSQSMLYLADGSPATAVVAAVFPDAASKRLGTLFGQHIAKLLGWPSVWQLQGANWLVWSTEWDSLQAMRAAIGGRLARTAPLTTLEPSPMP